MPQPPREHPASTTHDAPPRRILLLAQDFPPATGGIQTWAREIALRLARRGADVRVVAPALPAGVVAPDLPGVRVLRAPGTSDTLAITALPLLARTLRRQPADWVLSALWQTIPSPASLRALGARHVAIAAHGRELWLAPPDRLPGPLRTAWTHHRTRTLRAADLVLPVSGFTARRLHELGVQPARSHVLPNGVCPDRFHETDPSGWIAAHGLGGHRILLTVCRLVPRKGVDTLIRAMPAIGSAFPDTVLAVGGTGPDLPRLRALADTLGVSDRVRFLGRIPDDALCDAYSACEVFAMPARDELPSVEGFGLVYLEAGACSRPVVGSRAGGIPDAIRDGETGLLVPPDDPAALASAVSSLLADPTRAREMGATGRRRATGEASWDATIDRLVTLLQG